MKIVNDRINLHYWLLQSLRILNSSLKLNIQLRSWDALGTRENPHGRASGARQTCLALRTPDELPKDARQTYLYLEGPRQTA
jgi:hypothetical protein